MGKVIVMDKTISHMFKQDTSKLEDIMENGYGNETTSDGEVYYTINYSSTTTVSTPNQMCNPTQYKIIWK